MAWSMGKRLCLALLAVGSTLLVVGLIFSIIQAASPITTQNGESEVLYIAIGFSIIGLFFVLPSALVLIVLYFTQRTPVRKRIVKRSDEMPAYHFARPALYFSQLPPEILEKERLSGTANSQPLNASLPMMQFDRALWQINREPPIAQSEVSSALMCEDAAEVLDESQASLPPYQYEDNTTLPISGSSRQDSFDELDHSPPPSPPPPGYFEIVNPPKLHAMTVV